MFEELLSANRSGTMAQKVSLTIKDGHYDTLKDGERLLSEDLKELGLEEDVNHMRIEFDNEKSAKYCFWYAIHKCTEVELSHLKQQSICYYAVDGLWTSSVFVYFLLYLV